MRTLQAPAELQAVASALIAAPHRPSELSRYDRSRQEAPPAQQSFDGAIATVGSGAGAVSCDCCRSGRFPDRFPVGAHVPVALATFRFQPPPPRTVHAVLPHTAHRRRSPSAFDRSRQARNGLGATTVPTRPIRPS